MEALLIALEDCPRQTEEVLVTERLARQTAGAAQQTAGPQPAGAGGGSDRPPGLPSLVDSKAIGKSWTFSGDIDVHGQPEGMPWSPWTFVFGSYFGAFDPTATELLRQVETNVEDPVVVVSTSMTEVERRLPIQLSHMLALICRGKELPVVRRVPEGSGFEAWGSPATTRTSAGTSQLPCGRSLFSPTRLVGTPVWKWIPRPARENLLEAKGIGRGEVPLPFSTPASSYDRRQ